MNHRVPHLHTRIKDGQRRAISASAFSVTLISSPPSISQHWLPCQSCPSIRPEPLSGMNQWGDWPDIENVPPSATDFSSSPKGSPGNKNGRAYGRENGGQN